MRGSTCAGDGTAYSYGRAALSLARARRSNGLRFIDYWTDAIIARVSGDAADRLPLVAQI